MIGTTRKVGVLAAGAAVAGLIAGCGSSADTGASTGQVGNSAIAQAADVSGTASGEKALISITGDAPSIGRFDAHGSGAFNLEPLSGQQTLQMSFDGQTFGFDVLVKDGTVYTRYGGALGAQLSRQDGGKPWIAVDIKRFGAQSGISSLMESAASEGPSSRFQELEAASNAGVTRIGTATVNGVATTEYSATLNVAKEAANAPPARRAALQKLLRTISTSLTSPNIPVKVWIDSQHLIRRMASTETLTVQGTRLTETETEDILSYGRQPVPSTPPSAEVKRVVPAAGISTGG